MKQSKLLTVLLSITTAAFILSVSVAIPILLRPFYYAHIEPLELESAAGLSREQIVTAYDRMMDFCTGRTEEFSTGVLPWSESGKAHFVDVRGLFLLDLYAALGTGLILTVWLLLRRKSPIQPARLRGHGFAFWGSVGLCGSFLIIGGLAALDFDRAFRIFHALFFPGKDNWLFDPRQDAVITILPQVFFRNCAILILALILIQCVLFILLDRHRKVKQ